MPLQNSFKASAKFIDRGFHPDTLKNNRLSIQLRQDGFSFAQIDSLNKKVLILEDFNVPLMIEDEAYYQNEKVNLRLETYLEESKIHLQEFKSVDIVVDSKFNSMVPTVLYDKRRGEEYLKQIHLLPENFIVKTDHLPFMASENVYAVYAPLFFNLKDHFSSFKLKHSVSVLIQQTVMLQKIRMGEAVYVNVGENEINILAFQDEKLIFSNTFSYKEKEDFIYYILLVYNQLGFKPEITPLCLMGDIDRSSPLYAIAFQYIGKLDFDDSRRSGLIFGNEFTEKDVSKYSILTQSVLCE